MTYREFYDETEQVTALIHKCLDNTSFSLEAVRVALEQVSTQYEKAYKASRAKITIKELMEGRTNDTEQVAIKEN